MSPIATTSPPVVPREETSRNLSPRRSGPRMRRPLPPSARVAWAWLQGLPWRRRRLRRIFRMLDGRTPHSGTLVDIGGGVGVGTEEAVRSAPSGTYARCVVLESQRGMLARTVLQHGRPASYRPVRGSGDGLPFADGSADVLVSLGVLCCMEESDVPRAVTELGRVLRPGGYCVLGVPRGWASFIEPMFRSAGFREVGRLRPGCALYQRPLSPETTNLR